MKAIIYYTSKTLAHIAVKFYYSKIEINGQENIPKKGPYIYAINHQNAFLDAVIVGSRDRTHTYFMTRSDIFKPPFDYILRAMKMMPIYRIRDGYKNLSKNDEVFDEVTNILDNDNAILIFPEGNHGEEYYLRTLTKGISRLAIKSQLKMDKEIKIIPVGLNYFDHYNSGHKLIINYGPELNVKDFLSAYDEHPHQGLLKITKAISEAMKPTLVIEDNTEEYPAQKKVFHLSNEKYNFSELKSNIDNSDFQKDKSPNVFFRYLANGIAVLNWPFLALCRYILNNKVKQPIFHSSLKLAFMIYLFPLWLLFSFTIVSLLGGAKLGFSVIVVQLVTLWLRRVVGKYSH